MEWRPFRPEDLEECLAISAGLWADELVGRDRALKAWQWLIRQRSFQSGVIVEPGSKEILGVGAGVFVTSRFAESELRSPQPGLNARIIESIASRKPVVLDFVQLTTDNTKGQLIFVVLCSHMRRGLKPSQVESIKYLLAFSFLEMYRGYRFKRLLIEAIGQQDIDYLRSVATWRDVSDYSAFFSKHPESTYSRPRVLATVTRESVNAEPGSVVMPLFHHRTPKLRLKDVDQTLLLAALDDHSDQAVAAKLGISVSAVRYRWARLFERVSEVRPDLVAPPYGDKRGAGKRSRILEHVREYRDELRPFRNQSRQN